jgi:hypothetical protein
VIILETVGRPAMDARLHFVLVYVAVIIVFLVAPTWGFYKLASVVAWAMGKMHR